MSYKIFSAKAGSIETGTVVYPRHIADYTINVVEVGEEGRGRERDSVLVEFVSKDQAEPSGRRLYWAGVGKSRSGKFKLIQEEGEQDASKALVVMRSPIGFRGGNGHTGDRAPDYTPDSPAFLPFPGQVLAQGTIAQGIAGAMGSGSQLIALVDRGVWFRMYMVGRLYGQPSTYYYRFDGETLVALTPEQRDQLDLW